MKTIMKKNDNFTIIANNLILDNSISWKAKSILIYMLSRPKGWSYNAAEISKHSKDGINAVYSGLKELVKAKYVSRKKLADGSLCYYIFENKSENNIIDCYEKIANQENPNEDFHDEEKPDNENPNQENPNEDFPQHNKKDIHKERIILSTDSYIYKSKEFWEAFKNYQMMRKKIKKPMTEGAVKRMLKRIEKMTGGNNENYAIKLLNKSEDKCWLDIYETKEKENGRNKQNSRQIQDKHTEEPDYTNSFKDWN